MTFDYGYPGTLPSAKGWGPGWPDCQDDKILPLTIPTDHGDVPFPGGIREEAFELLVLVLSEIDKRGYKLMKVGCWGGACRATKRADGTQTTTPSVHSWYLAVDINAPENVFGASEHAIPKWAVDLLHQYGFRWLGPPIGDWMHFDFCGSLADLRAMTEKARRELGGMTEDDMGYEKYKAGAKKFIARAKKLKRDPGPAPATMEDKDAIFGWTQTRFGYLNGGEDDVAALFRALDVAEPARDDADDEV